MAFTRYEAKKISAAKMTMIDQANAICNEYDAQGLVLTLRQLYYQFVARGLIDNKQSEYKRIGDICRDARMLGLMDWDHLIDRTRNLQSFAFWKGPEDMIEKSAARYHRDLWAPQKKRVEVWIEKDAAIGVVEAVCSANSVPYFSCRGYTSMSEMHQAAQRIRWHLEQGEQVLILHIGDHDPSGIDMSRDIEDRLRTFITVDWRGLHDPSALTRGQIKASQREVMRAAGSTIADHEDPWRIKRIALNFDQVQQYNPPPNYTKITDSRAVDYIERFGDESWELDALNPTVMVDLIAQEVEAVRDESIWLEADAEMEEERETLVAIKNHYAEVAALVTSKGK